MGWTIVLALISSGVLSTLITALFQYLQTKKSKADGLESKVDKLTGDIAEITKAQKKAEGDIIRVELKLMISDFPGEESDILRLAEHYFKDLHGNWVMATTFSAWLESRGLPSPSWYDKEN